jgi:hypothetical protein
MFQGPFGPSAASVTVTGSIAAASGTLTGVGNQLQIANTTTAWAYCNFGITAAATTAATVAASYPVAPGAVAVVTIQPEQQGVSVILGTAPGTSTGVVFTRGEGV